ncbi:MAG: hypothetical protein JOZ27_09030 [Caulobacteraceae bacterium]|nr:hypothetical protein [Caulobacteraceae bacterium]
MKIVAILALVAGLAAAAGAATAQAPRRILRGEVVALATDSMSVRTKVGETVIVALAPHWNVAVLKPVAVDAIQPGSFIGTSEAPQADGTGRSLEVHVFPPGVKMGAGHYPWDLESGAMMTNGDVGAVTATPGGRALEVSYPGGSRRIVVPPGVPVVQITFGAEDLVHVGSRVFLIAQPAPGGGLVANAVSIGENGAAPPM